MAVLCEREIVKKSSRLVSFSLLIPLSGIDFSYTRPARTLVTFKSKRMGFTELFLSAYRIKNKQKFELVLTRRTKAYSSSCSQIVLVHLQPFRHN